MLLPEDVAGHVQRILIVDDDGMIPWLVGRMLERTLGQAVAISTATTAEEARSALEADLADLVILDDVFPGGTAWTLAPWVARTSAAVVSHWGWRYPPAFFSPTGHVYPRIARPFTREDFVRAVVRAVEARWSEVPPSGALAAAMEAARRGGWILVGAPWSDLRLFDLLDPLGPPLDTPGHLEQCAERWGAPSLAVLSEAHLGARLTETLGVLRQSWADLPVVLLGNTPLDDVLCIDASPTPDALWGALAEASRGT